MATNTTVTTLRLPESLWKRIRHMAVEKGTTANAVIVGLLERYIPQGKGGAR